MHPNPGLVRRALLASLLAGILLAGIPAVLADDAANSSVPYGGTVSIRSNPPGAAIFLNDVYRGTTPAVLQNVPPGAYKVNISLAGYSTETIPITLINGSGREIGVTLLAETIAPPPTGSGSVAVDSNPGGAAVQLDGNPAGTTPAGKAALVLNAVPAGSHTVTIVAAGYPPFTTNITVVKNQVVKVEADFLSPATTGAETTGNIPAGTAPAASATTKRPAPLSPLPAIAAAGLAAVILLIRRN